MSSVQDIKLVSEELLPILDRIWKLPDLREEVDADAAATSAVDRLKKVTREADKPTAGELLGRAEAVIAAKEALTEIIVQSVDRPEAVSKTKLRILEAQHTALGASFGRLLELSAFANIPRLLDAEEIKEIEKHLDTAAGEINQRRVAKEHLDLLVDIALTGARIAARLG